MTIDAHHHFWKYDPAEYDWISEEMSGLRRDFLPENLEREAALAGVDGVVSVQARQTLEETGWLLDMASASALVWGVVGWVPLAAPDVGRSLEVFSGNPKFKGVRHVVQGEPDEKFLEREDFQAGIRELSRFGLVYDILIFERQLPQAISFVDRHPDQPFVLDHVAKPRIKDREFEPWNSRIRELAKREHVTCKISGMVTEADWRCWDAGQLRPYFETVLEAFGPGRLMFGSDWPVCLLGTGYGQWLGIVKEFLAGLSESERNMVLGGTAERVYFPA